MTGDEDACRGSLRSAQPASAGMGTGAGYELESGTAIGGNSVYLYREGRVTEEGVPIDTAYKAQMLAGDARTVMYDLPLR